MSLSSRQKIEAIFKAGIQAVQPSRLIPHTVSIRGDILKIRNWAYSLKKIDKIHIIGAGKATASMALEMENILGGRLSGGIIAVKHGHSLPLSRIKVIEAGHPVPDACSLTAANEILQYLESVNTQDLVFFLLSGGASAVMADCPPGASIEDIQQLSTDLLHSGASIYEINTVRKHLSAVKGGGLARKVYPAKLVSLILSDVPEDDLTVIGSGPAVGDPSTFKDVRSILLKYDLWDDLPQALKQHLQKGLDGAIPETPKPGDPVFDNTFSFIIGNNSMAVQAASQKAEELGYKTIICSKFLEGSAREAARFVVNYVSTQTAAKPFCVLFGGETTVKVKNKEGIGGRSQELALAAALELPADSGITLLAGGTDGGDGPTEAAGAIVDSTTLESAKQLKLDTKQYLEQNNSYLFFKITGGHIVTGPTHTNVMDIVIVLSELSDAQ